MAPRRRRGSDAGAASTDATGAAGQGGEDLVTGQLAVQGLRGHGYILHMNAVPDVFSPAKLGPITLRNRIVKAATFEAASPDALVTDDLINYHRRPAAGHPAAQGLRLGHA